MFGIGEGMHPPGTVLIVEIRPTIIQLHKYVIVIIYYNLNHCKRYECIMKLRNNVNVIFFGFIVFVF